jgi:hypothetical protein
MEIGVKFACTKLSSGLIETRSERKIRILCSVKPGRRKREKRGREIGTALIMEIKCEETK